MKMRMDAATKRGLSVLMAIIMVITLIPFSELNVYAQETTVETIGISVADTESTSDDETVAENESAAEDETAAENESAAEDETAAAAEGVTEQETDTEDVSANDEDGEEPNSEAGEEPTIQIPVEDPDTVLTYVDHIENDPNGEHYFENRWLNAGSNPYGYIGWVQACGYSKTDDRGYVVEQCKCSVSNSAEIMNRKMLRLRLNEDHLFIIKAKRGEAFNIQRTDFFYEGDLDSYPYTTYSDGKTRIHLSFIDENGDDIATPTTVGKYKVSVGCGSYWYSCYYAKLVYSDYCGKDGEFEGQHIFDENGQCTRCEANKALNSNKCDSYGIRYELDDENKTATIVYDASYKTERTAWDVIIFDTVKFGSSFYKVTAVADGAFKDCTQLTSIELPQTLRTIGDEAFYGCTNMKSVLLNEEITDIGTAAFAYSGIETISFPAKVSTLKEKTFYKCSNLTTITFADRWSWNAPLTTVEKDVVAYCTSLSRFDITASMVNVSTEAFNYYSGRIALSCRYPFGSAASQYVNSTNNPTFAWRSHVYREDNKCIICQLNHDELDENNHDWQGVKYILSETEDGRKIAVVASYGEHLMLKDNDMPTRTNRYLDIPATVVKDGVTYDVIGLGDEAFKGISKLKTITLSDGLEEIGAEVFSGCALDAEIKLPPTVTTIKDKAFTGYNGDVHISCPYYSNLEAIKANAGDATKIVKDRHVLNSQGECTVCHQSDFLDANGFDSHGIKYRLEGTAGNETAVVITGHNAPSGDWDVVIPTAIYRIVSETVTEYKVVGIDADAFMNYSNLKTVQISKGVQYIGVNAFQGCSGLTSVIIGPDVTTIGENAFNGCTQLSALSIPGKVTSIGKRVFGDCSLLSSLTIPQNVVSINDCAFENYKGRVCLSCRDYANSDEFKSNAPAETIFTKEAHVPTSAGICSVCNESLSLDSDGCDGQGVNYILLTDEQGKKTAIVGANHNAPEGDWDVIIPASVFKGTSPDVEEYKVVSVGDGAFEDRTNLKKISLSEGISSIGIDAFYGCVYLSDVVIPEAVTSIGDYAFYNCSSFTTLTIPENVTIIGDYIIGNCTGFDSITIPIGVMTISDYAFADYLGTVHLSCRTYENYELLKENAPSVTFTRAAHVMTSEGICSVCHEEHTAGSLDKNNRDLQGVSYILYEDGTAAVGTKHSAPAGDWNVTIPETVSKKVDGVESTYTVVGIKANAFAGYTSLASVSLPDTLVSVEGSVFSGCVNLAEVSFSDYIETIADKAFEQYKGTVILSCKTYANGTIFKENAPEATFKQRNHVMTSLGKCSVCESIAYLDDTDRDCQGIHYVFGTWGEDPTIVASVSGSDANDTQHIAPEEGDWNVIIPQKVYKQKESGEVVSYDVIMLEDEAFYKFPLGFTNLKSVTLSEGMRIIGAGAFFESNIQSVSLPSTVEIIGDYAFSGCHKLESIEIPKKVTEIGRYTFDGCYALTEITIPSNVKTINKSAFTYCKNLAEITFEEGVKTLGETLFFSSPALTVINLPDSIETISDRTFASENNKPTYEGTVYYSCKGYDNIEQIKANAPNATFIQRNHVQSKAENKCAVCGLYLGIDSDNRDYQGVNYIFTTDDDGKPIAIVGTEHVPNSSDWKVVLPATISREEDGATVVYTVTGISTEAFRNQDKLTSLYIPETVTAIGDNFAKDCTNLTSVVLGCSSSFEADDVEFWNCKGVDTSIVSKLDHIDKDNDYECDQCHQMLYKNGFWVKDIPNQTYTGKAIKPALYVYHYDKLLRLNKDYTVKFSKNTNVGTAKIVITGKGNFSLSLSMTFDIVPADIGSEDFTSSDTYLKYSKTAQKPKPTIKWKGKALSTKVCTYTYYALDENGAKTGDPLTSIKDPGKYVVVVTAKENGNFTGSRTINITIAATTERLVKDLTVSVKAQKYTGSAICPDVVVKYKKSVLTRSEDGITGDYTVEYRNNVNIGTASVVITGIGDYLGSKTVTFKITGAALSKASVRGLPESAIYTGSEITFDTLSMYIKATKKTPEIPLQENIDYTVSYSNNVKAGKATVIFTGINGYSGVVKKSFTIKAFNIADDNSRFDAAFTPGSVSDNMLVVNDVSYNNLEYSKGGAKPKVDVSFVNGDGTVVELKEKTDYTLSYKRNTAANDGNNISKIPYVTITLKGNYKGSIRMDFLITRKDLSTVNASATDVVFKNKAKNYVTTLKLTDLDGKGLSTKTDYSSTLEYSVQRDGQTVILTSSDIVNAGEVVTVKATAKANSNYTGAKTATFRVTKASIATAKYSVEKKTYTGQEITLEGSDITLKLSTLSPALIYGQDFEIVEGSYMNNINKGTATVLIRGINNYGGTQRIKFTIRSKAFSWWWILFG